MTHDEIKDLIVGNRIFRRGLDDPAITMICDGQAVRKEGNKVAHEAEQNMLHDAVLLGEQGPDVEVLKRIFSWVFDCDLRS